MTSKQIDDTGFSELDQTTGIKSTLEIDISNAKLSSEDSDSNELSPDSFEEAVDKPDKDKLPTDIATSSASNATKSSVANTIQPYDSKHTSLRTTFEIIRQNDIVRTAQETVVLPGPIVNTNILFQAIKNQFIEQRYKTTQPDGYDWDLSQSDNMAMAIRDVIKLIPEYDGKEKGLDSFIKKIDRLWAHITDLEDADRAQFLLVLQIKLTDKAAEAVQDNAFADWEAVKTDLIEKITPHRNTEKSELKLCAVKQNKGEDVEAYAKRIEEALDTLNRSFAQEDQNETIKKENDRKARKTFENGLLEPTLRNKAIARGCSTLKEAVDYIIEQELRYSELKPTVSSEVCTHCKKPGHDSTDCRMRRSDSGTRSSYGGSRDSYGEARNSYGNDRNPYKENRNRPSPPAPREPNVICYKCNRRGHYANACPTAAQPPNNPNRGITRQFRPQNSPPRIREEEELRTDQVEIENVHAKN